MSLIYIVKFNILQGRKINATLDGVVFIFIKMFTLLSNTHRNKNTLYLASWVNEWGIYSSSEFQKEIPSDTLKKIQEYADKALAVFEKQPDKMQGFLSNLNDLRDSIFHDPTLAREFINHAYTLHTSEVSRLDGWERTQKIKSFSDFITDIISRIADINQIPRLSLAIRSQKIALESATAQKQLATRMDLHSLQEGIA